MVEPIVFEDRRGREFVLFDEDHSYGDIVEYVVNDVGFEETQEILDQLRFDFLEQHAEEVVVDAE